MSDIYKILERLGKVDPTPKQEEVYVPVKSKLEETMQKIEENQDLTDSVAERIVRNIKTKFPELVEKHGEHQVYAIAQEEAGWLCDDWPEGEGFGTSDAYGPYKATVERLGGSVAEGFNPDGSYNTSDDEAVDFDEFDYDNDNSMDTDEFDTLDKMGMFPADDADDDYATALDREQYADESVQQFAQGGKTYVTGGEEGDEVVKAFDDPSKAQQFRQANQAELNKPEPDPEKILQVADGDEEQEMQEDTFTESDVIYSPGDTVRVSDNLADKIGKKYRGKRGKVSFTQGGAVYVKMDRGSEVEFRPNELVKEGFGDYDDFEVALEAPVEVAAMDTGADVNPDMVEFDPENPEHRERLQRGTRVILTPVLFSEPGTDRGGVLTDLSKTGFFCKVIRNADGKTINVHMSDIEYADLYNNTVYENFDSKFNSLLKEDITVTRTENPDNPELDTMTITGTEGSVDELANMLRSAGLTARSEKPADAEPEMVSQPADMEIVSDGEEHLLAQMRREIHGEEEGIEEELANAPDERTAPVAAALAGGGLNKRKRQYNPWHAADNAMAISESGADVESIAASIAEKYGVEFLKQWVDGKTMDNSELEDAILDMEGSWDDGSGREYERIWREYRDDIDYYADQMGAGDPRDDNADKQFMRNAGITEWGHDQGGESLEQALKGFTAEELLAWVHGESNGYEIDDAMGEWAAMTYPGDGYEDDGSGRGYERVWNDFRDQVEDIGRSKEGMGEGEETNEGLGDWALRKLDNGVAKQLRSALDNSRNAVEVATHLSQMGNAEKMAAALGRWIEANPGQDPELEKLYSMIKPDDMEESRFPDDGDYQHDLNLDKEYDEKYPFVPMDQMNDAQKATMAPKVRDKDGNWKPKNHTQRESKQRDGAPLDEVDSFLNLYKAFGERGEKR